MQINFDLNSQEKFQLENGYISEVDLCVRHGVFNHEFIEDIDRDSVDTCLRHMQEVYEEGKGFVYANPLNMIQRLIYHPQIKYRVKCNAVSHSFSDWYDEMLEYIEYASKKIKKDWLNRDK